MIRAVYKFLASVKLALALLIIILACCLAGVTVLRSDRAWTLIFLAPWFNGLLALLVVNVAFCFFGRIWGRKVTLISVGMILFHLSFVAMFAGIIFNSFFYFRGSIRLTEGEALPSGDPQSYDYFDHGRFFNMEKLKGETALVRMHRDYDVGGDNKRAAYEIAVGEGAGRKQGVIYITRKLVNDGFQYFNDREGYSLLVILYDLRGRELYGAHVPLQSLKQKDDTYLYATGTKAGPESFPFPQEPRTPEFALQASYRPSALKGNERQGEVAFEAWKLHADGPKSGEGPFAGGKALVGEKVRIGDRFLSVTEVRYWVVMNVRYEPGKPVVLTSLWIGLGGMIMTFVGRLIKNSSQSSAVSGQETP